MASMFAGGTLALLTGCTSSAKGPAVPMTVVVDGDPAVSSRTREEAQRATVGGVEVTVVDPSVTPAEVPVGPSPDLDERLAAARQSYTNVEPAKCLERLGGDGLVAALLDGGARASAARVLFWKAACLAASADAEGAKAAATELAVYQLETPADVSAVTPEVEAVLGRAAQVTAARPLVAWRIEVPKGRAAIELDGRKVECPTPCNVRVVPGRHRLRLSAPGYLSAARFATAEQDETLVIALERAAPTVAAAQWQATYAGKRDADSSESLLLLSQAVRSRNVVLVSATAPQGMPRLTATLSVDGIVRARQERSIPNESLWRERVDGMFAELSRTGGLVHEQPLYKRPLFWAAVVAACAAAAVTTYVVTRDPGSRTEVRF